MKKTLKNRMISKIAEILNTASQLVMGQPITSPNLLNFVT
jgi:hypothetical protein